MSASFLFANLREVLVDQNLSPLIAAGLREARHDAVHTIDLGFERAEDNDVLLQARNEERIVVSADTDFGALLAESGMATPSVILIRRIADCATDVDALHTGLGLLS